VVPDLLAGRTVLIAAHGHSIRALVKQLDGVSDAQIAGIRIPNGVPLMYRLDSQLRPIPPPAGQAALGLRGVFLDDDGSLADLLRKDAACMGPDDAATKQAAPPQPQP
jgi:broad specificity phosphatase PhoE